MQTNKIEVCFSPAMYDVYHNNEAIVVVVDILRATSAICTAFMNGAKEIIPVATLEEAKVYKDRGYMVAAERDGIVQDFADFGNSPYNFIPEKITGKTIVYSTTNGTRCIYLANKAKKVLVGSFLNISGLSKFIEDQQRDVVVFCAGWKNKFNLEDSVFAGALTEKLLSTGKYYTICDSAKAAIDLWELAKENLYSYILKSAQKERLRKNGLDDVIEYCLTPDLTTLVPYFDGQKLTSINQGVEVDL